MTCCSHPFLPYLILLTGVLYCSVSTTSQGQIGYKSRGQPMQSRWIEGTLDLGADIPISDITGQAVGDFDGNGMNEVMLVSRSLTEIAWNTPEGLEPFAPLKEALHWDKALWDDLGKWLWVVARYPDRVEQYSFSGRVPKLLRSYPGTPRDMRIIRGRGITVLGREAELLELIPGSGTSEILIPDAPELSEAQCIYSEEGAPLLLLKQEVSGLLGFAQKQGAKWSKATWWEETKGTQHWEAWSHEDGQIGMLASCRDSVWYRELDLDGNTTLNWTPPHSTYNCRFWRVPSPRGDRIEFVLRRLITKNLQFCSYSRQTGAHLDLYDLGEPEYRLDPLLIADLDADGHPEIVYGLPNAPEWQIHSQWWPTSRRLFWKRPGPASMKWPGPVDPPDPWIRALAPLNSLEEVWSHEGRLHFRKGERWQTLQARNLSASKAETREEPAPEKLAFCHQLVVPYLDLNGLGDNNVGIAELTPHTWHQLTFIRSDDLSTEVWLDGQCLFNGLSIDHRYQYNALVFGAAFATGFHGHSRVSLDRVFLSGRAWKSEEIQSEFQNRDHNPDRYTADFWTFDSDSWAAGVSNTAPTVQSSPKSVPGVDGKAVSFDGRDDALRQFAAVPPGELTLAFFFRLDDETQTETQVLIDLYGMFNTGMKVKWAPTSQLYKSEIEGQPIRSNPPFEIMPSSWPDGAAPFRLERELLLLSTGGLILEEGALGWQQAETPPCPEAIRSKPWVCDGYAYVETENSELWKWNRASGWNRAGYGSLPDSTVAVACAGGLFLSGTEDWNWLESPTGQRFYSMTPTLPLQSIAWTPVGEYVTMEGSITQPWTTLKRRAQLMPAEVVFESWPVWCRWMGRAVILLTVVLGLGWMGRGRLNRTSQGPAAESALGLRMEDVPHELRTFLTALMPHAGSTIDTDALDGMISFNGKETNETIRARRARFVRDTNAWGEEKMGVLLIHRTKDPADRRRTLYGISTKLQEIRLD